MSKDRFVCVSQRWFGSLKRLAATAAKRAFICYKKNQPLRVDCFKTRWKFGPCDTHETQTRPDRRAQPQFIP
jgi:hypothetical protein